MFQLNDHRGPSSPAGFVEFDDRGNARWRPHETADTEETVIRILAVDWLQIVEDQAA